VAADDGGQVHVGEDVAVEDHRRAVQLSFGVLDRSAGAQRRLLDRVADAPAQGGAVAEDGLHALGAVGDREDDLRDAHRGQQVELVGEERPVHHRHHRLGRGQGEGPEPGALAPGQDDGFHAPR
jgi:hypothetical protein